jgi:VWFA-related protein
VRTVLLTLAAGLLAMQVATNGAQGPTFSARVEAVRVDVLVTNRGRPVHGLTAADFDVRDNGVRQEVDLISLDEVPLNVVMALDISGSLTAERRQDLRQAGEALLDALTSTDRAALVTFNQAVALRSGLTEEHARVRAALARTPGTGDTALVDATHTAMLVGETGVGRTLVVIFSDCVDTASWLTAPRVIETARGSEAVVYAVTGGRSYRSDFLDEVSESTGGRIVRIDSTRDARATFLAILDEFRQRYLLSYSPSGVATDGWHRIDVRVKGRDFSVKARQGYRAGVSRRRQ